MSSPRGPVAAVPAVSSAPHFGAADLVVGYGARTVLDGLDLDLETGTITALVGPNGSGKSTLLRSLARLLAPTAGAVYIDGTPIMELGSADVARRLAILPQRPLAPETLTVAELVEQGRYPHAGPLRMLRRTDHEAVRAAMEATGTTGFARRRLAELSGGEQQRAWIALALAQDTPTLLLDEPTTFLDVGHQLEVMQLVRTLNAERDLTVVLVLHDLNQAARYASRMIALDDGRIVADGPPVTVLTADLMTSVFGVLASVVTDPRTGTPVALPYALADRAPVTTQGDGGPAMAQGDGGPVTVQGDGGSVTVQGDGGPVTVQDDGGPVTVQDDDDIWRRPAGEASR